MTEPGGTAGELDAERENIPTNEENQPIPKRCRSKFVAWFDGHDHIVQCQQDEGHGGEFHTHERRWMDGEDA